MFGPDSDVPGPDVNTGPQVMGWMLDTYIMHKRDFLPGVITGKPTELGGSAGRQSATSRGLICCVHKAAARLGLELKGATAAIQGFGNVGSNAAKFLAQSGVKVVAISDAEGAYRKTSGIDVDAAIAHVARRGSLTGFKGATPMRRRSQLLELPVDILVPAALENQITTQNAPRVRARIIAEGANGPTTPGADEILERQGTFVIPDILCNAGGVTVSYLEWVQNRMGYYWPEERVNDDLRRIMEGGVRRGLRHDAAAARQHADRGVHGCHPPRDRSVGDARALRLIRPGSATAAASRVDFDLLVRRVYRADRDRAVSARRLPKERGDLPCDS